MSRLGKAYKDFHGVEPTHERKVKAPKIPKRAWVMGHITEIRYTPYYLSNPGAHKNVEFRHLFSDRGHGKEDNAELPILAVSPDGRTLFIVRDGSKYYVSQRGIIG